MIVLKQAPENSIRELTGFEKVTAVSNSVFYPRWLENGMELCLETLDVYVQTGGVIDPGAYIRELRDSQGNSLNTGLISAESNVDFQTPGCYEIHYRADDGTGNTGETWMTVIVTE